MKHEFEETDWVVYKGDDERAIAAPYHQTPAEQYPEAYAWVPRLDQLLDLLNEELAYDIGFYWAPQGSFDHTPQEHWCCYRRVPDFMAAEGRGSCREEAALRLLIALKARS